MVLSVTLVASTCLVLYTEAGLGPRFLTHSDWGREESKFLSAPPPPRIVGVNERNQASPATHAGHQCISWFLFLSPTQEGSACKAWALVWTVICDNTPGSWFSQKTLLSSIVPMC